MINIDLHIHSTSSDGNLDFKSIIDEARKKNIDIISITDHDSIDAYSNYNLEYAKKNKIRVIPGIEISTKYKKCGIHILGYNFDLEDQNFKKTVKKLQKNRLDYLYSVSKKLNNLGFILDTEYLSSLESVTKAHIANNLIDNPINEKILNNYFNHKPSMGEFIETIMNEDCPAFVKKDVINPVEAATIIRNAGGKVYIAHPVAYTYEDKLPDDEMIELIKEISADGIESYYIYVDVKNNVINDIEKWNKIAKKLNILKSVGSDFHKDDGLRPLIGFENISLEISQKELDNIIKNITSKKAVEF